MRKNYSLLLTAFMLFVVQFLFAQNIITNQVIVCSGGNFNNPDDYVSVASYKPSDASTSEFGTIFTQSVQDIVIDGHFAYVAAQDSIVKFNIDTYERIAATEAIGVHNLAVADDILIASFWYPATKNFVQSFSTKDLSQLAVFSDISDEAAGILIYKDLAYVAIPGGWASTKGKIAVIKFARDILIEEIDLGEKGVGVSDLFFLQGDGDFLVSVNKSPWGTAIGYLSLIDLSNHEPISFAFEASIGSGIELFKDDLYLMIDGGIGRIDLALMKITEPEVVPNPGNGFSAAALDVLNGLFYATTTDYTTTGEGTIYNMEGEISGSFKAGISAEALAIDYRDNTGIFEKSTAEKLSVFPNPATQLINFSIPNGQEVINTFVMDISGRVVYHGTDNKQVNVSELNPGLYFITIETTASVFTGKFVKQ